MKYLVLLIGTTIAPLAVGMTTSDYYSLAPEIFGGIISGKIALYTICAGSFVAFYFFGWQAHWLLRALAGLCILGFLEDTALGVESATHTMFEAQIIHAASIDSCSEDEPMSAIYIAMEDWRCSEEGKRLSPYQLAVSGAEFYKSLDWVGRGMSNQVRAVGFEAIPGAVLVRLARYNPLSLLPISLSVLIWFLCPSKRYCRRRGWISD